VTVSVNELLPAGALEGEIVLMTGAGFLLPDEEEEEELPPPQLARSTSAHALMQLPARARKNRLRLIGWWLNVLCAVTFNFIFFTDTSLWF